MNSARRDLCGGYPVTGIPTATVLWGEKIKRDYSAYLVCRVGIALVIRRTHKIHKTRIMSIGFVIIIEFTFLSICNI
ncbi:hypothetical protein DVB85_23195 [Klebsiella oxytoca]|nr:hypothetical protein DVB85_23195 [Klebsiella oxytoca]TYG24619.1 hypothetical protein DJ549_19670 [Klebsiella grimontii]GJK45229.1 hypothetical protein TUM17559_33720 [Enterobacter cloacae]GJL13484.1 hypothetical protein TUM17572_32910 [Klebsiella oxytoca]